MINANELRRGNWILEDGKPIRVDEIRHWYFGDAEPIELSPEILEKAGFKKGKTLSSGFYGYSNGVITLDNDFALGLYDGRMDDPDTKDYYPETKYLHQLQNLYFALTGQELTINL